MAKLSSQYNAFYIGRQIQIQYKILRQIIPNFYEGEIPNLKEKWLSVFDRDLIYNLLL